MRWQEPDCTSVRVAGLAARRVPGGIGFTMSIFIATLAFPDASLLAAAKLGVLLGSMIAAVLVSCSDTSDFDDQRIVERSAGRETRCR